ENTNGFNPNVYEGSIYPGYDYQNDKIISGEFNGDGRMDFIVDKGDGFNIYDQVFGNNVMTGTSINISNYEQIIANRMLSSLGKSMIQSGITLINETLSGNNNYSQVEFRSYYKAAAGLYYQYTKTWDAPTYGYEVECGNTIRNKIPKK